MNFRGRGVRHRYRRGIRPRIPPQGPHPVIRIALAGNPNSGKTSIFNALTGQRQHIGNYPGVTVEKKSARIKYGDKTVEFVDLPGTYSLSAYSMEEIVSRDFVLHEKPDVIIDILDSTNLERHLYLLLQFQELEVPLVGALNMSDEAETKGIRIDHEQLTRILGIPLVATVGRTGRGVKALLDVAVRVAEGQLASHRRHLNYGKRVELAHEAVITTLETDPSFQAKYSMHWVAIKLLENDEDAVKRVRCEHRSPDLVLQVVADWRRKLEHHFGEDCEVIISEQRYAYIHGALRETMDLSAQKDDGIDVTERLDAIALNRYLGIPVFLIIMFLIYQLTFALGNPLSHYISLLFYKLSIWLNATLSPGPLQDLLSNGIIKGVGGVIVFLPIVLLLFLGLSFLEDTGYMSRAAFVMDKFFHTFGLHGRSFIPFMISTGCAVPGVMSARVLANPKDRIVTIMVSPLMMCGAKAPVIAMLAAAFFPARAATVFWGLWFLGWFLAFGVALLFRSVIFKGAQTPFVMELPPYRKPTFKGVLYHMWEKASEYVKKAGTVILAASVIVWFLLSYPKVPSRDQAAITGSPADASSAKTSRLVSDAEQDQLTHSFGGRIGRGLEPVIRWAGYDWKIGVSLVAGVAAKEVIISTLGILYGIDENDSGDQTQKEFQVKNHIMRDPNYSPLMAFSLMVFVLLYVPCLATLAVVRKELNSWKWPLFQALYTLVLAYAASVVIYQGGLLLGLGV